MLDYIENVPIEEFKNYKTVIYKISEHIERGFAQEEVTLGYFASKGEATLYVQKLPDCHRRRLYIKSIGVQ